MKKKLLGIFGGFVGSLFLVSSVAATELVYEFVNPSFGGNPFNGPWLLQQAQLQNQFKEKREVWWKPKTPLERFTEQLEYTVLSRLAQRIAEAAFGEEKLQPGEYTVGSYKISVTTDANGITVVITEISTGNITSIQVPYY